MEEGYQEDNVIHLGRNVMTYQLQETTFAVRTDDDCQESVFLPRLSKIRFVHHDRQNRLLDVRFGERSFAIPESELNGLTAVPDECIVLHQRCVRPIPCDISF